MSQQGAPGVQSASYNSLNQITSLGSGATYVYDAAGNLTDDGVRTFSWDAENRLIGIGSKADPAQVVSFRYDGLGRRTAIVAPGGVETRYLWCGEALCQARGSDDTVSRRYYSEGELVPGGASLLYAQDRLGSVREALSPDGSPVTSYDYDAYGNPVQPGASAGTDFRYAGMFYEENSGLYLTHYRAYDPVTARWLSRDPIEERGGMNLYAYVGGNPANSTDRFGLRGDPYTRWMAPHIKAPPPPLLPPGDTAIEIAIATPLLLLASGPALALGGISVAAETTLTSVSGFGAELIIAALEEEGVAVPAWIRATLVSISAAEIGGKAPASRGNIRTSQGCNTDQNK